MSCPANGWKTRVTSNQGYTMKKQLFSILAALGFTLALFTPAHAADQVLPGTATANVVSNVFSAGGYLLKAITWINTSTNIATIKFYDTSNTSTTVVQAAYTSFGTPYATNYVTTFTNAGGIVITNTTPGIYTPSTSVSASTNERPYVFQMVIAPGAAVTASDLGRMVGNGLAVLPNQSGTYSLTYSQIR